MNENTDRPATEEELEALTPEEQRKLLLYFIFDEGFEKALEEIAAGKYEAESKSIIGSCNGKRGSMIDAMAQAYCAGLNKGLDIAEVLLKERAE